MSTAKFIEHNGERIALDHHSVITELRCDLCGQFIDTLDVLQIKIEIHKYGASLAAPVQIDAHPSCARKLGERIGETIDRAEAVAP